MVEKTFGSPAQVKKLQEMKEEFGGNTSVIKMREFNDVSEFLTKKRELEEKTKDLPEVSFK